ncbi:MAG: fused MFS/spermidine synthase, partial [Planctomycetales bacterium]|nr:fused MFS/spermidine synthase [Planctomycetales bacterium]
SITVVELIPEVVAAARLFADYNLGVLEDKRTQIEIDDARHYLLATDQRFDVIVADLFVPWETKTGYLYTVDHYRVAKSRLRSGGLYCQWLPMWQLGEREFAMIADSMAEVFPQVTLWWCKARRARSVIALVGSDGPLRLDTAALDNRLEAMWRARPERDAQLADAHDIARLFVGGWRRRAGAPLNTDEHPRIEFGMPVTYADERTLTRDTLFAYFQRVLSSLPQEGATFDGQAPPDAADRLHWQSVQLRK